MRLWTIHPRFLDTKGLLAVWREGLLALHVLAGKTKGYMQHPQLERWRKAVPKHPEKGVATYLREIHKESRSRFYRFDWERVLAITTPLGHHTYGLTVTRGQVEFERMHLLKKIAVRGKMFNEALAFVPPEALIHPIFTFIEGDVESWEKVA